MLLTLVLKSTDWFEREQEWIAWRLKYGISKDFFVQLQIQQTSNFICSITKANVNIVKIQEAEHHKTCRARQLQRFENYLLQRTTTTHPTRQTSRTRLLLEEPAVPFIRAQKCTLLNHQNRPAQNFTPQFFEIPFNDILSFTYDLAKL